MLPNRISYFYTNCYLVSVLLDNDCKFEHVSFAFLIILKEISSIFRCSLIRSTRFAIAAASFGHNVPILG